MKNQDNKKNVVSITEAAKINKVTRQAIYVAISQGKLKAYKKDSKWEVSLDDLYRYRKEKYSRKKSTHNGELLFDNNKGYYSIKEVAEMLNVPVQKIYYAAREGLIHSLRRGCSWVVHIDDVLAYKKKWIEVIRRTKRDIKQSG